MANHSETSYHGKTRIRVCGLCLIENKILLVRHQGIGETGVFWSPPGGGTNFGESLTDTLVREFSEEVNLNIRVNDFLFVHEFTGKNLHAIEVFFKVTSIKGIPYLGHDPEFESDKQWLKEVKLFSEKELALIPANQRHQIFQYADNFPNLFLLRGFFKSQNNSIK